MTEQLLGGLVDSIQVEEVAGDEGEPVLGRQHLLVHDPGHRPVLRASLLTFQHHNWTRLLVDQVEVSVWSVRFKCLGRKFVKVEKSLKLKAIFYCS